MNLILLIFLIIGLVCVTSSWIRSGIKCPPPKIIYKYIETSILDQQFNESNKPSVIYNDIFKNVSITPS